MNKRAPALRPRAAVVAIPGDWPGFWSVVQGELRRSGYSHGTLLHYRQVIRQFAKAAGSRPFKVNASVIKAYVQGLGGRKVSSSWLAGNITVLRTVFDKLAGMTFALGLRTPQMPQRLPVFLSETEVRSILAAAPTLRDQLLLGLLYGCGLKPGELAQLRWRDILLQNRQINVAGSLNTAPRLLPIPSDLLPLLSEGVEACDGNDHIFAGARHGKPLTRAMIDNIVRRASEHADLAKSVVAMTLRHSYAIHCLDAGMNLRQLQVNLGHYRLLTTDLYRRCRAPAAQSPLDDLPIKSNLLTPTPRHSHTPIHSLPALPILAPGIDFGDRNQQHIPRPLFDKPLTSLPLAFPFKPEGALENPVAAFCHRLKLHLSDRFLALRGIFSTG